MLGVYKVIQEERSILSEVIVSVILSKNKKCMCTCVLLRTVSEIEVFHCTDEQYAMSSHELQSALMLKAEFSEMYYTR
jgi:hypothetical protein